MLTICPTELDDIPQCERNRIIDQAYKAVVTDERRRNRIIDHACKSVAMAVASRNNRNLSSVIQWEFRTQSCNDSVFGNSEAGTTAASLDHDNKTGRYLPVFHAAWDPKNHDAFVCGSMTQPRIVEVFSTAAINKGGASFAPGKRDKKTMALGCKRVGVLGDGGEYLGSVQSRSAFHPFLDVVVCGNASGRVHIFK